jgi:hypothetical protein
MKHSSADPPKRVTQRAPSSHATPVAPSAGVTGSTTAEFYEGLKNRETDQQGNLFTPSLFISFDLFC